MITTISLPAFSGRLATCSAAQAAAPDEMPTSRPSSVARLRAMSNASSLRDPDRLRRRSWCSGSPGRNRRRCPGSCAGPCAAGQHRAGTGSTAMILHAGLSCLEHFADAGDGAAGADAGHDDIDLAVGVAPDFLGRGLAMDFGIGRILELLRHEGAGRPRPFPRPCATAPLMPSGAGRQHQLGAEGLQQPAAFRLMLSGMVRMSL